MQIGKLIGLSGALLGLTAAVPAGIDQRVLPVDGTGVALGTVGNPIVTTSTSSGGSVTQGTTPWITAGNLTNNNAAPGATNLGVLPALAGAVSPTQTEGNQALLSTNLSGQLRTVVQGYQANGVGLASNPVIVGGQSGGNTKFLGLDVNGGVFQGNGNAGGTVAWTAQGAGAAGAAVSGNPLLLGASDGTNIQTLKVAGAALPYLDVSTLSNTSPVSADGLNSNAGIQMDHAGTARLPAVGPLDFNGTTWDRHRDNVDVTLLGVASRTTTQTSADIVTYNAHSLICTLDVTTVGTGSLTLTINYKDPASSKYILLLSGAVVNTNSTNVYTINPNIPAVANVSAQKDLGRIIQIIVTANNANPVIYSCGYTLVS